MCTFTPSFFHARQKQRKMIDNQSSAEKRATDFAACWNMTSDRGRQTWNFRFPQDVATESARRQFLENMDLAFRFDKATNPHTADQIFREKKSKNHFGPLPSDQNLHLCAEEGFRRGAEYLAAIQEPDGHWAGDYGGPHFLLPGLIITAYLTKTELPDPQKMLMKRYMLNHQNSDGGWGLHIEGESTLFGTVMQYVALRLLGAMSGDEPIVRARRWIQERGGAVGIPSWGKFYLSVLGAFEYDGCNTLIPELWLLPRRWPIHPGNYWCHTRMVYLPMSYCYGHRVRGEITPLIKELRQELYTEPYHEIRWNKHSFHVHQTDAYVKPNPLLKLLYAALNIYEKFHHRGLRKKALNFVWDYIHAEDEHTDYINIGPVNQVINSLAVWHQKGSDSEEFRKHTERWNDYLWVAEDGMKMNGYNGSQLWDTAFAAQAICAGKGEKIVPGARQKAYEFVDYTQIKEEVRDHRYFFRHDSVGGWPFSTNAHGWPITDCTAEGLSAVIALHAAGIGNQTVSEARLRNAVDLILSFQNPGGGWSSYEKQRAGKWLEYLNPAEVFGDIMADYPYVECTSACIRALCEFSHLHTDYRENDIHQAIKKGVQFIKKKQRPDGSWLGSWAVCFTYAGWFGLTALALAGESQSEEARKGCEFLLSKQNADGSWGESYLSSVQKEYIPHREGQVINTAWALLGLMNCRYPAPEAVEKGIGFLLRMQKNDGDWPQQSISGVFNFNCMISYSNYRNIFPLWALGAYTQFR
jgi:squalene/oxidosqualene cyclase-like protein